MIHFLIKGGLPQVTEANHFIISKKGKTADVTYRGFVLTRLLSNFSQFRSLSVTLKFHFTVANHSMFNMRWTIMQDSTGNMHSLLLILLAAGPGVIIVFQFYRPFSNIPS